MSEDQANTPVLLREQTASALKVLYGPAVYWGIWMRLLAIGCPISVAFALHLGLSKEDIGVLVSVGTLMGLSQVVTSRFSQRVKRKRALMLLGGTGEMVFPFLLVGLVFLPSLSRGQLLMFYVPLIMLGALTAHVVSPLWQAMFVSLVPENIRGRYMAKRLLVVYLVAIVTGIAASRALDLARTGPGRALDVTFGILFLIGLVTGIGGYLFTFFLPDATVPARTFLRVREIVRLPFTRPQFGRFVVFSALWNAGLMMATPYYIPFMYDDLAMSYTSVGFLDGLNMAVYAGAYLVWGACIDRFGCKPLLQALAFLGVVTPLLYLANTPGNTDLLYCGAVTGALFVSGGVLGATALLFKSLPKDEDTTPYFAVNMAFACIAAFCGTMFARLMLWVLRDTEWTLIGVRMNNLRTLFLISSAVWCLPLMALMFVREEGAATLREFLRSFSRGNFASYLSSYMVFRFTENPLTRAQAALRMGRSRSPMAVSTLVAALDDPHPEIRSSAAFALGETRQVAAAYPLIDRLEDGESDVRTQAAEALGKIPHGPGMEPLFKALDDSDARVRISAIRALADIGGPGVLRRLRAQLDRPFDREEFPSLVEALSHLGDVAIVRPALASLGRFQRDVIRLQVLNCVCRALGAKNRLYRMLMAEDLRRPAQAGKVFDEVRADLRRAVLRQDSPGVAQLVELLRGAADAHKTENHGVAASRLSSLAAALEEYGEPGGEHLLLFAACGEAIGMASAAGRGWPEAETRSLFMAVVLQRMVRCLVQRRRGDGTGNGGRTGDAGPAA